MLSKDVTPNQTIRFATFNVAMSADKQGEMFQHIRVGSSECDGNKRVENIAAIIQNCRPDVILLCEFDHLGNGGDDGMLDYFLAHYLGKSQHSEEPIFFPYYYLPPSNTGLPIKEGVNVFDSPENAHGFGRHHGQYGFVLLSRFPLDIENIRTWQQFLWCDMPNHRIPENHYPHDIQNALRLSSKNHVLVPVVLGNRTIHVVACHPTPPVFDGPERRNARRNADELRLMNDILHNERYLVDDKGLRGGLSSSDSFVVMGDLNADPINGEGDRTVIAKILAGKHLFSETAMDQYPPCSAGASSFFRHKKIRHPSQATHSRGLRLDYVLPSNDLSVIDCGVFWPSADVPSYRYISDVRGRVRSSASSDHRLVWLDIVMK